VRVCIGRAPNFNPHSTSFKSYSITTNWNHKLTDAIENLASILYLFYFLYTPYYY
jgi:hypothetical protein